MYSKRFEGVICVKDFHEAILQLKVSIGMGNVYKKAIEVENNPETNAKWNGNYASVKLLDEKAHNIVLVDEVLRISLISHTLPNLKETVSWYESMGCEVISTNYKEGLQ